MQFVVPQFIDVESKIIGPITPKQFIILIVTAGFIFITYKLADFTLFLIEGIIILLLGITIAFVKVNGQPIYYFILSLLNLVKKPLLRVWRREEEIVKDLKIKEKETEKQIVPARKPLSTSHLSQLSLMVDTGGRYEGEELLESVKSKE
jgi:hypothetical protein